MPPYTQVLSALRKNDLICLCDEFRLPTDGSVVNLRNRLKDYMNLHRNTLYRNPRYNPLFPRHRRPARPIQQPEQASPPSTPPSSPNPSHRSSSRASSRSYDSWHGIDRHVDDQNDDNLNDNPLLQPPQSPHRTQHLPLQQILQQPHDPHFFPANPYADYLPPPSNAPAGSQRGSIPPTTLPADGCKYFLVHFQFLFPFPIYYSFLFFFSDTMKSTFVIAALCSPLLRHYAVLLGHYAVLFSSQTLCSLFRHYAVLFVVSLFLRDSSFSSRFFLILYIFILPWSQRPDLIPSHIPYQLGCIILGSPFPFQYSSITR